MDIFEGILYGIVVVFTQLIEAITGFGSTVIAMPFLIAITGSVIVARIPTTLHTWLYGGWIVATDFKKILWRQYFTIMLCVMIGLPIGIFGSNHMSDFWLKLVLAAFMIVVSINGIIKHFRRKNSVEDTQSLQPRGWKMAMFCVLLFLGGIIHGAFSSGGPLLIIYTTLVIKEKGNFRATMCAVWFTLNSIILTQWLFKGFFSHEGIIGLCLLTLPFLLVGAFAGSLIHKRISAKTFTKFVFIILLLSGCFMGYSAFLGRSIREKLKSPDGHVIAKIIQKDEQLTLKVFLRNSKAAQWEIGGIAFSNEEYNFTGTIKQTDITFAKIDETYSLTTGKTSTSHNQANEITIHYVNDYGKTMYLLVRAYNDGVAFRYAFDNDQPMQVKEEHTVLTIPERSNVWAMEYQHDSVGFYLKRTPSEMDNPLYSLPVLVETPRRQWLLIHEADVLGRSAAASLSHHLGDGKFALTTAYSDRNTIVAFPNWATPWRMIVAGDTPATIVETTMTENLNPPSVLNDESCIKPDISVYPWWGNSDMEFTTYAHKTALPFVFGSGWTMMCDFFNSPARPVLQEIEAAWDETKFLAGYPGNYIVVARRKGEKWTIGALNAGKARKVTIRLDFLNRNYNSLLLCEDDKTDPNNLCTVRTISIKNTKRIRIKMAENGGFVGIAK